MCAGCASIIPDATKKPGAEFPHVPTRPLLPATCFTIQSIADSTTGLPRGPLQGGTTVIIRGQGLGWPASVTFDGIPATNVTGVSDQKLTCTLPEGLVEEVPVDVAVTLVDGRSVTAAGAFTYYLDIDFVITPNVGLPAGGNTVTFSGIGLLGVSQVLFGTQAATFTGRRIAPGGEGRLGPEDVGEDLLR